MSLPYLIDLIDDLERKSFDNQFYGNDFGLGLYPHHIHQQRRAHRPSVAHLAVLPALLNRLSERPSGVVHPHHRHHHGDQLQQSGAGGVMSAIGKDGFQVCMDVEQFKPSELSVKVVDNAIVVEGKHEEREDEHGYISRHFVRRYALPKGYESEKVVSTLSSDGVLTVSIPKPQIEEKSGERVVQIQQTGPAHLNVKPNSADKGTDASNGGEEEK